MDYDSFLELVKNRRSIRQFKSDPIPDEYIDKIIEAARWAPSGFNLQPWEFVVVKDKKLKGDIAQFCRTSMDNIGKMEATREDWQQATKPPPSLTPAQGDDYSVAPVFILLFGDTRTNVGLPMYRRFNTALKQEAYKGGLASAFLYMHLAAASLGLGSQWVSAVATPFAHCMIKTLLGIPEELEIYDMMAVGYPAYKPSPRLVRNREEMIHYDYCGEGAFRTGEAVKSFIVKIRNP
jgi:nitroreductase